MDGWSVVGGILGLFNPLELLAGRGSLLERARERFPDAPLMVAREPSIDAGRALVLVADASGLVIVGEDEASQASWARVSGVVLDGETVRIAVVASDASEGTREFSFERLPENPLLAWLNTPAAGFVVTIRRILLEGTHAERSISADVNPKACRNRPLA